MNEPWEIAPDSLSLEEIQRRMRDLEAQFDCVPDTEEAMWLSAAEYLALETELERITDPHRRRPRH
jgi:hypothetical protein